MVFRATTVTSYTGFSAHGMGCWSGLHAPDSVNLLVMFWSAGEEITKFLGSACWDAQVLTVVSLAPSLPVDAWAVQGGSLYTQSWHSTVFSLPAHLWNVPNRCLQSIPQLFCSYAACYMLQAPKPVSELCSNIDGMPNIFPLPSNYVLKGDLQIIVFCSCLFLFYTKHWICHN